MKHINCYVETIIRELCISNKYLVFLIDLLISTNSYYLKNNILLILADCVLTKDISLIANNYNFLKFLDFLMQETSNYSYIPNKLKPSLIYMISQILLKLTKELIEEIQYDKIYKLMYFYFSLLKYETNMRICNEIISNMNEIMNEGEFTNQLNTLLYNYDKHQKELSKCKYNFEAINNINLSNSSNCRNYNKGDSILSQLYSLSNHPYFSNLFITYHYVQMPNIEQHIVNLLLNSSKAKIKKELTLNFNYIIYYSQSIVNKLERNNDFDYSLIILSNIRFIIEKQKLSSYINNHSKLLKQTIQLIDHLYYSDNSKIRSFNEIIINNDLFDLLTSILNIKSACTQIKKDILVMILKIINNSSYIVNNYIMLISDVFNTCVNLISTNYNDLIINSLDIIDAIVNYNDISRNKFNIKADLLQCELSDKLSGILCNSKNTEKVVLKKVEDFYSKHYE